MTARAFPPRPATREEVARYAHRLYEERGRAEGHALDDWLAAERALLPERDGEGAASERAARPANR